MVYLFLAEGFEEIEALTPVDILRRADITVQTVGVSGKQVKGSHGIVVEADIVLSEVQLNDDVQAVILPGGMPGTIHLQNSEAVKEAVTFAKENGKFYAAICAAPSVLGQMGYLAGKEAICFPGFEDKLEGATLSEKPVCRDGNCITAKGMGVATEFALALVSALCGQEKAEAVFASLQAMERMPL